MFLQHETMRIKMITYTIIICIAFAPMTATGFEATSVNESFFAQTETDSLRQKPVNFIVLPIIFKSPDTGWAFGALPQVVFRSGDSRHPSSVRVDAYYTEQKQYHFLLRSTNWFQEDRTNVDGKISVKKWPTFYYGIGNDTPDSHKEGFTENLFEGTLQGIRRIGKNWYAGGNYSMRYGEIREMTGEGVIAQNFPDGTNKVFTSGLAAIFRYDTRDHHYYPTRGFFHNIEIYTALKALASDYAFTTITADLRMYLPLHKSHSLALQVFSVTGFGDIPFRQLPSVGAVMRGYSNVQHIDKNLALIQAEYRFVPVAWRLGFVAFAAAGDVFNHLREIAWNTLKYNAGFGIRFVFSREEKINVRADYGIGRNTSGDYIDLGEAF